MVARSSNPEGRSLQQARTDEGSGPAVEDLLLAAIAALNHGRPGARRARSGAVVGATLGPSEFDLADLGGVILAPGLGAQGATAAEVAALFGGCPPGSVLASSSRSLLAAGPDVVPWATAAAQGPRRDGRRPRLSPASRSGPAGQRSAVGRSSANSMNGGGGRYSAGMSAACW